MTRFTVARDRLAPALNRAARIALTKSPITIITTVKIAADLDGLHVTATDLDSQLEELVQPEPLPDWAGCVDAHRLAGFAGALPTESDITISADSDRLEARCGRSVARLPLLPAEDFPVWRLAGADMAEFEIPAVEFCSIIKDVGHAIPEEKYRYWLDGIFLHAPGVAVATDGHRLMRRRLSVEVPSDARLIVPTPTCTALQPLLRGLADTVRVTLSPTWIAFACENWTYRSKLIDGTYPDYTRTLPARLPDPVVVSRTALADAVARLRLIPVNQKSNAIVLSACDGELVIATAYAPDNDIGEGEDAIPASGAAGVWFGVNARYLAEALAALPGAEQIELHIAAPPDPVWLCAVGEEHDGIVLMPQRVAPPQPWHEQC